MVISPSFHHFASNTTYDGVWRGIASNHSGRAVPTPFVRSLSDSRVWLPYGAALFNHLVCHIVYVPCINFNSFPSDTHPWPHSIFNIQHPINPTIQQRLLLSNFNSCCDNQLVTLLFPGVNPPPNCCVHHTRNIQSVQKHCIIIAAATAHKHQNPAIPWGIPVIFPLNFLSFSS